MPKTTVTKHPRPRRMAHASPWQRVVPGYNGNTDAGTHRLSLLKSSITGYEVGTYLKVQLFCEETGYHVTAVARLNHSYWYFHGVSHEWDRARTYVACYYECDKDGDRLTDARSQAA